MTHEELHLPIHSSGHLSLSVSVSCEGRGHWKLTHQLFFAIGKVRPRPEILAFLRRSARTPTTKHEGAQLKACRAIKWGPVPVAGPSVPFMGTSVPLQALPYGGSSELLPEFHSHMSACVSKNIGLGRT